MYFMWLLVALRTKHRRRDTEPNTMINWLVSYGVCSTKYESGGRSCRAP